MKRFKQWVKYGTVVVVTAAAPVVSMAQFAAVGNQGVSNLLGEDTAGSETGIYEIAAQVPVGLGVAILVVIAFVGYALVRTLVMKSRGK